MIKFIKRYWFLSLLAFIATILVIINFFIPKKENIPQKTNNTSPAIWNGLVPGQTKQKDISKTLGAPDPKQSDFTNNDFAYPRTDGARPNEVITDGTTVQLIKEKKSTGNLDDYKKQYGDPEEELFDQEGFKLYAYFSKGFAILASDDGTVLEVWHFSPTTKEQFLQSSWAKGLSEQPQEKGQY